MIRTFPKPLPAGIAQRKKPREIPKRRPMTLAIGMECLGGLIVAADTRTSYEDGNVSEMQKVSYFHTRHGAFAIAQSAQDANAANSLIRNLENALQELTSATLSYARLENLIEDQMQRWYVPNDSTRATVELLIAACLNDNPERRMYCCEPPNTLNQINDYHAIGGAWTVADPIYKGWVMPSVVPLIASSPHKCLCIISYLMHKAKERLPSHVGGHTDAVLITEKDGGPFLVRG